MTDRPGPAAGEKPADDARQWREAAWLRRDHPRWIVIWLAPIARFRAYGRLPGARRDTTLTADTAAGMDGLIGQAEQAGQVGATTAREGPDVTGPAPADDATSATFCPQWGTTC